jgi:hypothetical protein
MVSTAPYKLSCAARKKAKGDDWLLLQDLTPIACYGVFGTAVCSLLGTLAQVARLQQPGSSYISASSLAHRP